MLVYFLNHSTAPVNLGGAERSMIKLVEEWCALDPELEVLFLTKAPRGRFIAAVEERGWNYRAFPFRGWALPGTDQSRAQAAYFAHADYMATLSIIDVMEKRRPDLVVTNTLVAPWAAFAAKALGIPHAWFIREYGDLDHGLQFTLGRQQTFEDIGLLSEAVFVNSLALRDHVAPYIDDAKLAVVYPEVDESRLAEQLAEPASIEPFPSGSASGLRITMVGRLSASKGQLSAIDAVAVLASRGISASLCLVGSSEPPGYERTLRDRASAAGIAGQVRMVGEQDNPMPYVAAADVCVTASTIEAFGRTTLEYLSAGKPVVASSTGGSAELVENGVSGYLYQAGDAEALADALESYARDPELRGSHGLAAAARAAELRGHSRDNRAAIDRLKRLASSPAYRLPNAARYWFGFPDLYVSTSGRGPRVLGAFLLARVRARVKHSRLRRQ